MAAWTVLVVLTAVASISFGAPITDLPLDVQERLVVTMGPDAFRNFAKTNKAAQFLREKEDIGHALFSAQPDPLISALDNHASPPVFDHLFVNHPITDATRRRQLVVHAIMARNSKALDVLPRDVCDLGEALEVAAREGNEHGVAAAIHYARRDGDLDALAPFVSKALNRAAIKGHSAIVDRLMTIDCGVPVDVRNDIIIQAAASGGHVDIYRRYADAYHPQPQVQDSVGLQAAFSGHIHFVQFLLRNGATQNHIDGIMKGAGFSNNAEIIQLLHRHSIVPSDESIQVCMASAAMHGRAEAIDAVMTIFSDRLPEVILDTAFQFAVNKNHPGAVDALLKHHGRPSESLVSLMARSAAAAGFAGVFKLLAPLEVNVAPYTYNPAMLNAIHTRNLDMVEALVRNSRGVSFSGMGAAAGIAIWEDRTALLDLVLAKHPESFGRALQFASNVGRTEIVADLLRHPTGVLDPGDLQKSMEYAINRNHIDTLKTLLDNHRMTPVLMSETLFHAAKQGKLNALECIVNHPIKPFYTALPMALMLAANSGHVDCTELLMRQIPAHKLESAKRNAIKIAIQGKHKALVTSLLDQGAVVPPDLQSEARNLVALDGRIDLLRDLVGGKRSLSPPSDAEKDAS